MQERKISVLESGLIWFGAAVSIAEILTGTYLAPLGFSKGMLAIILGHAIGGFILFLAGFIGGKTAKSAMGTVRISFGHKGTIIFAALNLLQLFAWTSIMIYDGALAANSIWSIGQWSWALLIGALIVVWVLVGVRNLGKINRLAMGALFILTLVLSYVIFGEGAAHGINNESISFGMAVELSAAMPLSWLPLISDYTREAKQPLPASIVSALVYTLVSMWMYVIGMGIAIYTNESDIAQIMLKAGLGSAGLLVIVFATVTTTFLDAWSAGVSGEAISKTVSAKYLSLFTAVMGTICAIFFPITNLMEFLYLIGSVFAPMVAILLVDYYLLKQDYSARSFSIQNLLIWAVGFVIYRLLLKVDFILGSTLLAIVCTGFICLVVNLSLSALKTRKTV